MLFSITNKPFPLLKSKYAFLYATMSILNGSVSFLEKTGTIQDAEDLMILIVPILSKFRSRGEDE